MDETLNEILDFVKDAKKACERVAYNPKNANPFKTYYKGKLAAFEEVLEHYEFLKEKKENESKN